MARWRMEVLRGGRWRGHGTVVEQPTAEDAVRYYAGGLALDPRRVRAMPVRGR